MSSAVGRDWASSSCPTGCPSRRRSSRPNRNSSVTGILASHPRRPPDVYAIRGRADPRHCSGAAVPPHRAHRRGRWLVRITTTTPTDRRGGRGGETARARRTALAIEVLAPVHAPLQAQLQKSFLVGIEASVRRRSPRALRKLRVLSVNLFRAGRESADD